jgi:large subunit ribosomal protein L15
MRLHDLKPAPGSHRDRKRLGRGNASGQGTTAGKGTKGEKARSGGMKAGFRGMSSRNARMAKRRGFTNRWKIEYHAINLKELAAFESGATVSLDSLRAAGLVRGKQTLPKILGDGEISVPLHFVDVKVSGSARQKIEAAGGTITGVAGADDTEAATPAAQRVESATPAPVVEAAIKTAPSANASAPEAEMNSEASVAAPNGAPVEAAADDEAAEESTGGQ